MFKKSFINISLIIGLLLPLIAISVCAQEAESPGAYRLGPGDSISIRVFGEEDLSRELTLGEDGRITYAFVGQIQLSGQSIEEVETTITERLKGDYLVNPQVSVTMAGYRPFFINGEVNEPGSYPYQPGLTVSKAISLAGGLTERASDKKIFLILDGGLESDRVRVSLDDAVEPGVTITIEQSFF